MAQRTGPQLSIPWTPVLVGAAAFFGAVGLAALAHAAADGRSEPELVPAASNRRIALIGDSYAAGLGPELARLLPDFRYEGRVGTGTASWAAADSSKCGACGGWLAQYAPAVTLISLGVNDGSAPNSANYQAIVRMVHGTGSRVVWIEPPARVDLPQVNMPAIRSAIASLGVPTVPATETPLGADHLHPATGYRDWAKQVASFLNSASRNA